MGKACGLTGGMFTPNVLHGVLQHLFLIHLFSTLLITLFTFALIKCYVRIIFTILFLFFHKTTFGSVSFVRLYM